MDETDVNSAPGVFPPVMFKQLNKSNEQWLEECEIETHRGGGPGGQKADKTSTVVRLRHRPTGLTSECGRTRSQHKNRSLALRELKIAYALNRRHEIDFSRLRIPSQLDQYVENGLRVKRSNPHFPFVVKLVFDVFEQSGGQLSTTSEALGVSTRQLVRFFHQHSDLRETANQTRKKNDLHRLKPPD